MIQPMIEKALGFIEKRVFENESGEFMITINDTDRELYAVFFHADLEWKEDGTKVCGISNLRMNDGNLDLKCRIIELVAAIRLLSDLTQLKSENPGIGVEVFEELGGPFEPIAEFYS